jgi:hypothetical protein
MTNAQLIQKLIQINACDEALDWVRTTPGTPEELWNKCERPVWLEFLVRESKVSFDWAEHNRQVDQLWAEYHRQVEQLWAECHRQGCDIIRSLVLWADIEGALGTAP